MSGLTVITLLVVVYGLISRGGLARALALGGATPAGAALVVGGTALPTFYAVSLVVAVAMLVTVVVGRRVLDETEVRRRWPPGASYLVLFAGWSIVVTLLAPLAFDGQLIVSPTSTALAGGVVTSSNLAQIGYLVLGVLVMVYVARSPHAGPQLIGMAAGTCTVLSLWRYGYTELGLPFPEGLFDNSPSFAFIETAAGGIERFRGVLSEPSGLAGTSLVTVAYMVARAPQVTGLHRAGCLALAGVAIYLGVVSTSATFVVGGLALAAIMAGVWVVRFLARRSALSRAIGVAVCVLVVVGLFVVPPIVAFVESAINDKLGSSSYTDRSSANTDSIGVFLDTYGVGVGLGSARASSFAPTLLSATGLVGTALFVLALVSLVIRAWPHRAYHPVIWALVSLFVVKLTAGPDLSDSSGITWLALGLLSRCVLAPTSGSGDGGAPGDSDGGPPLGVGAPVLTELPPPRRAG